nr:LytTR family DNA-binding domain-containing protein [Snuella sedimenti]
MLYQYDGISFFLFFLECISYAALVVLIPYSVALLIIYVFQLRKKNNVNNTLNHSDFLIGIPDGNNVVKLSVPINNLLYFESADNYVVVQYLDEGKTKKKLIRNTLKNLENSLDNSVIKRCHRSFVVNLKSIKLIEKVSGKFFIHIKNSETLIPISTNYIPQFKDYIS